MESAGVGGEEAKEGNLLYYFTYAPSQAVVPPPTSQEYFVHSCSDIKHAPLIFLTLCHRSCMLMWMLWNFLVWHLMRQLDHSFQASGITKRRWREGLNEQSWSVIAFRPDRLGSPYDHSVPHFAAYVVHVKHALHVCSAWLLRTSQFKVTYVLKFIFHTFKCYASCTTVSRTVVCLFELPMMLFTTKPNRNQRELQR